MSYPQYTTRSILLLCTSHEPKSAYVVHITHHAKPHDTKHDTRSWRALRQSSPFTGTHREAAAVSSSLWKRGAFTSFKHCVCSRITHMPAPHLRQVRALSFSSRRRRHRCRRRRRRLSPAATHSTQTAASSCSVKAFMCLSTRRRPAMMTTATMMMHLRNWYAKPRRCSAIWAAR